MEEIASKNLPLALRNRPWGVSAAMIDAILSFSRPGCSVPCNALQLLRPLRLLHSAIVTLRSGSQGQDFLVVEPQSGCRWGSRCWHPAGRLMSLDPLGSGNYRAALFYTGLYNLLGAGDLLSPVSSPISPGRAGTVPWVPWRPPYAIMSSAYGSRRPIAFEGAPPALFFHSNLILQLLPQI
jgi:hypothetical protein